MSLQFNIAIDGYSSCGKSTIAKSIANKYDMRYIDTGAMYRALTLFCMRNNIIKHKKLDVDLLKKKIENIYINFQFNSATNISETMLNEENVESLIRSIDVTNNVSIVAQIKEVREQLIRLQKEIGRSKNVVMDGRDIGTKVFPDAELKLFITARADIRAKRRHDELVKKGENVSFKRILKDLNQRDEHDTKRKINPLIMAEDAILIDNSFLSIKDQNMKICDLIKSKL